MLIEYNLSIKPFQILSDFFSFEAKNHRYVTVVTDPSQYAAVLDEMKAKGGQVSFELRQKLALAAYSLTAHYDSVISAYLSGQLGQEFPQRYRG